MHSRFGRLWLRLGLLDSSSSWGLAGEGGFAGRCQFFGDCFGLAVLKKLYSDRRAAVCVAQ